MLNHLARRLLIMPVPLGENTHATDRLRDVIKSLVGVLELPQTTGKTHDIGGPMIT